MTIAVKIHNDVTGLKATVDAFVLRREAENCLLIGILSQMTVLSALEASSLLASIHDESGVIGAAVRMSLRRPLVLTEFPASAIPVVAERVRDVMTDLRGVMSLVETSECFASRWCVLSAKSPKVFMSSRLFQLVSVQHPAAPNGTFQGNVRS